MTAEELTKAFLKTPAMVEHAKVIGTVNDRLDEGDTETVSLQVPKQFLAMLEYDERENAAHEGRQARSGNQGSRADVAQPASRTTALARRRARAFPALPRPVEPLL